MQAPDWIRPALVGAGVGAIALAVIGFNWGGWVTGSEAAKLARNDSMAATTAALTPYCLEKSRADPKLDEVLAKMKAAPSYNRRQIVANTGWATLLGDEKPNRDVAQACQLILSAAL